MAKIPRPLDPQAVKAANEQLWKQNPELKGRQLSMSNRDQRYREDWAKFYNEAKSKTQTPPPKVQPQPVENKPPEQVVTEPQTPCSNVAEMTHEQKIIEAIKRAHERGQISDEVLKALPDPVQFVGLMVVTGVALAGLSAAAAATASTGVGAIIEGVAAAIVLGLAALGIITSLGQIKTGVVALMKFFNATRCDSAETPEDLDRAGKDFAEGIAEAGVGTILLILSYFGAKKGVKMGKGAYEKWTGGKTPPPPGEPVPLSPAELDAKYGAPKEPAYDKPFEKNPDGSTVKNPTLQKVKPGQQPTLEPGKEYIWLIDENGDMVIGEEVPVKDANGLPIKDARGRPAKLGHPTLVDGKPARIGGELRSNPDGSWDMNKQSGRYSRHPDRGGEQLNNAADVLRGSGTKINTPPDE